MNFYSSVRRLMSAVCISLCALFITSNQVTAQSWVVQSIPTPGDVLGVFFLDGNNGWAVGGYWDNQDIVHSTILHTSNGGNTWHEQVSNANTFLFGITFADLYNGWACGWSGVILHTTDGGNTWVLQDPGTDHSLLDITCVSPTEAWAVGQFATILHTVDGGMTWTQQEHPLDGTTIGPRKVVFLNPNQGWAFGEFYTVFQTADGGQNWTYPGILTPGQIWGGDFADVNNGWAVGHPNYGHWLQPSLILHTTDGGQTWTPQPNHSSLSALMDAAAIDANNVWVVGYTGIYRTNDGGQSWINQPAGTRRYFAISAVSEHNAWAVGEYSTVRCFSANSPIQLGSVSVVSSGPPDWTYRLNWISGSLSRLTFTNVCHGTIGSVTGDAAQVGWQVTNYVDSVVFTAATPLIVGSLTGFRLSHPSCSDFVNWSVGDSSGIVDGPLPVNLLSFTAQTGDALVKLNWSTGSEYNISHFELRRDGWSIANVQAANSVGGGSYSWSDPVVVNGQIYQYSLSAVNLDGTLQLLGTLEATPQSAAIPVRFSLAQNYPNPFNASTTIEFSLPDAADISLRLFNLAGQEVAVLASGVHSAGSHSVNLNAKELSTGIYFYRLESLNKSTQQKMVLLK